jgi:hypothetical protein
MEAHYLYLYPFYSFMLQSTQILYVLLLYSEIYRKKMGHHIYLAKISPQRGLVGCPGLLDFVERMWWYIRESCYCLWPKRQGCSRHPHASQLAMTAIDPPDDPPPLICACLREMNHTGTCRSRDPSAVRQSRTNFITIVPKWRLKWWSSVML